MKLSEIGTIAKTHGITPGKMPKSQLIRLIQSTEGNFDCYATAFVGECNQGGCSWRTDCLGASSIGEPSGN